MEKFSFDTHIDMRRMDRLDRDCVTAINSTTSIEEEVIRLHHMMMGYSMYELAAYVNVLIKASSGPEGLKAIRHLRSMGWLLSPPNPPEEKV